MCLCTPFFLSRNIVFFTDNFAEDYALEFIMGNIKRTLKSKIPIHPRFNWTRGVLNCDCYYRCMSRESTIWNIYDKNAFATPQTVGPLKLLKLKD